MNKSVFLMVLLLCLSLSACTAALVGGGGGYAVSEDTSMTASVKSALISDNQIDAFNVSVGVYRGVVTLHGHVKSSSEITRAVRLSRTISGVKKVVSKLAVIK